MRLPSVCLIVLVGPSGAGKSHWAADWFRPEQIVSSDALRAAVGASDHDQRASSDAFEILDLIIERRLSRRLLTVVDTLGLDPSRREAYVELARRHQVPCHAVVFDTAAEVCRARNRLRARPVPAKVLAGQLAARDGALGLVGAEGFDGIHPAEAVEVVPAELTSADVAAGRQRRAPVALRFGLQLSSFGPGPDAAPTAERLAATAAVAEAVGFTSIWVLDHMVQIPQVGRRWEDMLESWTTLSWLAAHTRAVRLGTLVTGVTLRNPAHLAKIVATVDVLSGGRAICGLGLAWWQWEHALYGWPFPPVGERYSLLESGKPLGVVCHAPAALLATTGSDGTSPFSGYRLTGFTNAEETQAGLADKAKWLLQDRLVELGADFQEGEPWTPNVVVDRNLHTGQNPASSGPLADEMVKAMGGSWS